MQSTPEASKKLSIAVVGGGIGGLTLAVALGNSTDFQVDIYEAAPSLTEQGAGITLWERGWEIITKLGIEPDMTARLQHPRGDSPALAFEFRKGDQEPGISFYQLFLKGVNFGGPISYHRADVQHVLLKHIANNPSCRIHLSHRLTSYTESTHGVSLTFHNGARARCDLLVAADGIKSVARKILMQDLAKQAATQGKDPSAYLGCVDPFFSGSVAYRGLVQSERFLSGTLSPAYLDLRKYWGKNKHLIVYPISQGNLVNVVAFASDPNREDTPFNGPWVTNADKDEMYRNYAAWEDEVQVLLKLLDNPTVWAIHAVKPLPTYVSNRVALLGDSAHAMTPHQGAGASQAIEDAYILACIIKDSFCATHTIPQALQVYDSIRRPFASRVQAASRHQGLSYEFNTPGFDHIDEVDPSALTSEMTNLMQPLIRDWEWQWNASAEADRLRALGLLESFKDPLPTRLHS
ncbi:hypothetical protein ONZ45_g18110 [Pleurotus djamor]|nr:hypothetical protein ONZ45_g18110 [Pleurotus djamor]